MTHCCAWCAEEAMPEKCPYFKFDWEYEGFCAGDQDVDKEAPTVRLPKTVKQEGEACSES